MVTRRPRLLVLIGLLALLVTPVRAAAEGAGGNATQREWRWSVVKLWASGAGFAVGRRSAGYGLQGGAALSLADGIDVTASYLLTGFSLGNGLDTNLADVDERIGAPIVGLRFQF